MMAKGKLNAPDESIRDRLEFRDGLLYWKNTPENKKKLQHSNGMHIGAGSTNGHATVRINGERYCVNRLVYWLKTGEWPEIVCYIDGDATNNRFENLKAANHSSNRMRSSSLYGIEKRVLDNGSVSFNARITLNNKTYNIGTFKDELTALFASWKMRETLFPGVVDMPKPLIESYLNEVL